MADNSFQVALLVKYGHVHRVIVTSASCTTTGEVEGVAHIAQLTHGLEIIPAPVVGTIESVGNDGHGMLCLSIVRTAQHAIDVSLPILNPQFLFADRLR